MSELGVHVARWKDCQACPLAKQRFRICLGRGAVPADVLFIGEAPGASEDALGQPFVGPAGKLLDQIIERGVEPTVTYAMTNLVCCFPREAKGAGINEPEPEEIKACRPRLVEFVRIVRPRLIVLLGQLARKHVCGQAAFAVEGEDDHPHWIPQDRYLEFCELVHPAAILRMPLAQRQMATQKSIVVLRRAVEDMLQSSNLTNRGGSHAGTQVTSREQLRAAVERLDKQLLGDDADIPF